MKLALLAAVVLAACPRICVADNFQASHFAFPALTLIPPTRCQGLGAACVALGSDSQTLDINPSSLAWSQTDLSGGHDLLLSGGTLERLSTAIPSSFGVFCGSIKYVNYGEFERRGQNGEELPGTFLAFGTNFEFAWARALSEKVGVGFFAGLLEESAAGSSARAFQSGLGGSWKPTPAWKLGATLTGPALGGLEGHMPAARFTVGCARWLAAGSSHDFLASGQAETGADAPFSFGLGLEYSYHRLLTLRAGYHHGVDDDLLGFLSGLAAGFGLAWQGWKLDYAATDRGVLGMLNSFSASYRFSFGRS